MIDSNHLHPANPNPDNNLVKPDESTADIMLVALMILFALTGFILLGIF